MEDKNLTHVEQEGVFQTKECAVERGFCSICGIISIQKRKLGMITDLSPELFLVLANLGRVLHLGGVLQGFYHERSEKQGGLLMTTYQSENSSLVYNIVHSPLQSY